MGEPGAGLPREFGNFMPLPCSPDELREFLSGIEETQEQVKLGRVSVGVVSGKFPEQPLLLYWHGREVKEGSERGGGLT
ncbi:hypothetical protein EF847_01490 [Actinobacteria bacterium YIM 96077]|uniref:Uncharacterized protein n=1 Tax=Phytoactinopolyspora halophila TaxID=1981511 RepID=A0A329QFR4_9ACTN|nr:hypothetical protein EF847_01490 [Actinobacteria bacterium YIM 96077]RAW11140.1 hypothetical protein DPM12_17515 [Phytoactinopolyspora halophila]